MSRFVLTAQLQLQAPTNTAQIVRQIQSQLNNVQVNVQVQGTAQATRQVQQVAQSLNAANSAASNLGRTFAISVKRFTALAVATRAVSLFTNTLANATQEAIDFERQLVKVSQVTGQSIGELKGLTKTITTLATGLGVGSKSLLEVSTILLQAGLNANDTEVALKSLAKAALAPNFDSITETAEGAIAILAQFQKGVGALEGQLSSINAVAGAFAVEAGDLIDVIRRTGGVFKASGGSLNELLALFTSVRATTRESAESIGTGLRTIFTRIQRPKTIEFLKQFGVELVDLEGKFVGPFEAVKRLSQALTGLGEGDITFIRIAEELGGFRQIGKVLPLLQQFSIAQDALNVAQKAGNGLTKDAQTAQQALAIRITKVKEEFLALVRSITETSSFQFFANTTLNLASALIRLADALKPIIPLLTAVATIKLAQGLSGFIGGFGRGIGSGRTFNEGGKVLKFARGGMVPGSGNRDTVPAMLQPGEFVIRKSSVNKLGAGNLAAMNENRYAAGGIVTSNRHAYGIISPSSKPYQKAKQAAGSKKWKGMTDEERQKEAARFANKTKGEEDKTGTVSSITLGAKFGASFLRGYGSNINFESRLYDVLKYGNKTGSDAIKNAITKSTKLPLDKAAPKGSGITVKATNATPTFLKPDGYTIFEDEITNIIPQAFDIAAKKFNNELSVYGPPKPLNQLLSKSAISSIEGQFFEAFVRSVTNNVIRDEGNKDSIFDFLAINKDKTEKLFGTKDFVLPNEFKNDANPINISKTLSKAASLGSIRIQKFAKGGSVKNINILSSALQGFNSYEGSSKDILAIEGLSSLLSKIQQFYGIKSAKVIGAGEENIAFDIGKKILKISKTGFGSQLMAKSFGFKNKELKKIGNYQLSNSSSVTGYEQIKTFGKLTAALQNKVSLGNDKKRMKDYQILKGKLSKSGQYWLDAHPENMGYDKLGNPTVIDGLVFPKTFVNKNLNKNKREDIELESMTAESIYESQFNKKSKNKKNTKRQKYLNFIANLERMYALAIGGKAGKDGKQIIQKFAKGGMAQPLVDDILSNAPNTILPKPQSAIQKLINSGGGFVDIDRTLKRTIGDQAYARARTEKERQAVLSKYFANSQNRLNDIKTAGLTQFGTELQNSIKSGQLSGSSIRVISKSPNTPGVAEYLSRIFGIPSRNFAFTGGRSKVPLMRRFASGGGVGTDTVPALLTPGEFVINKKSAQSIGYGSLNRMNKVGKYASGGVVQRFVKGGAVGNAAATMAVKVDAGLSKKEVARINMAMAKDANAFNLLTDDIKRFNLTVEEAQAAYKSLARSINAGKKSEDALQDARDSAHKQMVKSGSGIGKTDRTQQAAPNLSSRLADYKVQQEEKQIRRSTKKQLIGNKFGRIAGSTNQINNTSMSSSTPMGGKDIGMMAIGFTAVTASLQSMLPPLDENSSAFTKLAHSALSLVTSVGAAIFALQSFGISLNKQSVMNFLGGKGIGSGGQQGVFNFARNLGISKNMSGTITGVVNGFSKLAGPLAVAAATSYVVVKAFNALVSSTFDVSKQLKSAIESGNVAEAENLAGQQYSLDSANTTRMVTGMFAGLGAAAGGLFGTTLGATVGTLAAPVFGTVAGGIIGNIAGTAIGAAAGTAIGVGIGTLLSSFDFVSEFVNTSFGGNTRDSVIALAGSQAQAVKASKSLAKASEDSAKALQEFQNGTASAIDVLKSTVQATEDAATLRQKNEKAFAENEKNKSGFFGGLGRGALRVGTLGIAGLLGVESGAQRNQRIDKENQGLTEQAKKAEEDALKAAQPGLQVLQRQVAATGGSFENFLDIVEGKDKALFDLIIKTGQTDLIKSFDNLAKEAERTKAAFNAINLDFQKVSAVSGALSIGLENYLASQEAGNIGIENNIRTLEASITNAAQGISDTDFTAALGGASNGLRQLGASEEQIRKFEQNLGAINTAQKFFAQASQEVKNTLAANFAAGRGANMGAVEQRELFASTLINQLDGVDEKTKKRISDAIAGAEISTDDLNKIAEGNLSVLDKVLKDLGETTLNQVIGPLKEYGKYQKTLVDLTKKRIELENNLISAQRGVLDAQLEAQEIISKYGGPALTPQIRTQNAIAQANIQTQGTRVSALRTGSAAELNQRNRETRQRLIEIGNVRTRAAAGNVAAQQQLQGRGGAELEAEQKRLQELAKSDYETTKLLIKNKEEELKLLQEKNKLEKDSIDALVSGDMEKFFEQQAAAGAQAAIALGSDRLQGAFGASALGAAAQDIRRQQEAGQQTLFGQQLAGPGGLTERAFGAAVGARGITDPRLAQIAAGTTAEESGVEAQIRELAATLPNYAQTQLESSQQELYAAQWQVKAAEMQLQAARANVEERSGGVPIAGFAKGGVVYANRGIFVPRGTDTVPAMLTPGEFVVRREAVQRGNNLQLLQSMNRGQSQGSAGTATGMARGGVVNQTQYLAFGGFAKAVSGLLDGDFVGKLTQSFNTFISEMSRNIDKLNSTNFTMKLDTTNVNVNLTGGSFLNKMKDELREELMKEVASKIQNYKAGEGGSLKENRTVLG